MTDRRNFLKMLPMILALPVLFKQKETTYDIEAIMREIREVDNKALSKWFFGLSAGDILLPPHMYGFNRSHDI